MDALLAGDCSRSSARAHVRADVRLRRPGRLTYRVSVYDLAAGGAKVEFVERPNVGDRIWITFNGFEMLTADVRWVVGFAGGIEFVQPLHTAVFDLLARRLAPQG